MQFKTPVLFQDTSEVYYKRPTFYIYMYVYHANIYFVHYAKMILLMQNTLFTKFKVCLMKY